MVYLPPELYSSILGQVTSRRDLCAVTRVSRLLHSESEPLIYRDLDLDHRIRSRTKIAICRRLCTSDVLPLYVQSFTWRWRVDSHFLAFSLLLPRVLSRLTRLRSLSLMLPAATGGVRLFGRYRFKLVILKIICLDERLNDDCLLPFLETQDKLQHLEFGHIAHLNHLILPDRPLPLGFLPNLSVLCAPYVDSVRLISGRSITHLSGWANSDYSSLKALSLSATPLMALVIGVGPNEDGSPRLPMLPDFVPDLEALYLVLQDRSSNDGIVEVLAETLSRFKKLERLALVTVSGGVIPDERIALQRLLETCPSLLTVMFKTFNPWMVWTRGTEGLVLAGERASLSSWWANEVATVGLRG